MTAVIQFDVCFQSFLGLGLRWSGSLIRIKWHNVDKVFIQRLRTFFISVTFLMFYNVFYSFLNVF